MEKDKDLPQGCYEMQPHHVDEAAEILATGFRTKNDVWGAFDLKQEDLVDFFKKALHLSFEELEQCKKRYNRPDIQLGWVSYLRYRSISEEGESSEQPSCTSLRPTRSTSIPLCILSLFGTRWTRPEN
jgi:hypothetical protein